MRKNQSRLERYRKHAKEGKLPKPGATNAGIKSATASKSSKQPNKKNSGNTQSDSAKTDKGTTLEHQGKHVPDAEHSHDNILNSLAALASTFGYTLILVSIGENTKTKSTAITAFNPHFHECKCDNCKDIVATIKHSVSENFDEYGKRKD